MSAQNLNSSFILKFEDVDPYQFVDSVFPLNILLIDPISDQPVTGQTATLILYVVFEDINFFYASSELVPDILEVISKSEIHLNGQAETKLLLKDVSMNRQNKRFVIAADAYNNQGILIAKGLSNPITSVQHKLIIQEENTVPYSWYKDEGGKDKCIELKALLVDANKRLVRDRYIPLRALLTYSGGQPVPQQSILALSPDSRIFIDETGSARFKIRINEVSNRHRGQMFQVLISPDLNQLPKSGDISPALSVPVEVKSKRNSNTKKNEMNMSLGALYSASTQLAQQQITDVQPPPQLTLPVYNNIGLLPNTQLQQSTPMLTTLGIHKLDPPIAYNNNGSNNSVNDSSTAGVQYKKQRISPLPTNNGLSSFPTIPLPSYYSDPLASMLNNNSGSGGSNSNNALQQQQLQLQLQQSNNNILYSNFGQQQGSLAQQIQTNAHLYSAMQDCEQQYEHSKAAFKHIVNWTQLVLASLQHMQWIQIGYDNSNTSTTPSRSIPIAFPVPYTVDTTTSNTSKSIIDNSSGLNSSGHDNSVTPSTTTLATNNNTKLPANSSNGSSGSGGSQSGIPLYNMSNPNEQIKEIIEKYSETTKDSLSTLKTCLDKQLKLVQLQSQALQKQSLLPSTQSSLLSSYPYGADYTSSITSTSTSTTATLKQLELSLLNSSSNLNPAGLTHQSNTSTSTTNNNTSKPLSTVNKNSNDQSIHNNNSGAYIPTFDSVTSGTHNFHAPNNIDQTSFNFTANTVNNYNLNTFSGLSMFSNNNSNSSSNSSNALNSNLLNLNANLPDASMLLSISENSSFMKNNNTNSSFPADNNNNISASSQLTTSPHSVLPNLTKVIEQPTAVDYKVNLILAKYVYEEDMLIGMPAFRNSNGTVEIQGFYTLTDRGCQQPTCHSVVTEIFFKNWNKISIENQKKLQDKVMRMLNEETFTASGRKPRGNKSIVIGGFTENVYELTKYDNNLEGMKRQAMYACLLRDIDDYIEMEDEDED